MIVVNHILFVCDLYFRHRKSFRLSGRIMGTLPYVPRGTGTLSKLVTHAYISSALHAHAQLTVWQNMKAAILQGNFMLFRECIVTTRERPRRP